MERTLMGPPGWGRPTYYVVISQLVRLDYSCLVAYGSEWFNDLVLPGVNDLMVFRLLILCYYYFNTDWSSDRVVCSRINGRRKRRECIYD